MLIERHLKPTIAP